jgi:hypothetical protein
LNYCNINWNLGSAPPFEPTLYSVVKLKTKTLTPLVGTYHTAVGMILSKETLDKVHDPLPEGKTEHPHAFFVQKTAPKRSSPVLNGLVRSISSLLLCNNSVTSIDNTQLSLYLGYKRKVSYSHYSHIQSYKCIRVLYSSGSLCSSSHVRPTHSCGIMLLASSSMRPSY